MLMGSPECLKQRYQMFVPDMVKGGSRQDVWINLNNIDYENAGPVPE